MQRINFWFGLALAITVVLALSGNQTLRAQGAGISTARFHMASPSIDHR